jgi:hypothetical protein
VRIIFEEVAAPYPFKGSIIWSDSARETRMWVW